MTISKKFLSKKVAAGLMLAALLMVVPARIVAGPNNTTEQAQLMLQLKKEIAALKKEQKKQRRYVYKVAAGTALATLASAAVVKYAYDHSGQLPSLSPDTKETIIGAGKILGYATLGVGGVMTAALGGLLIYISPLLSIMPFSSSQQRDSEPFAAFVSGACLVIVGCCAAKAGNDGVNALTTPQATPPTQATPRVIDLIRTP